MPQSKHWRHSFQGKGYTVTEHQGLPVAGYKPQNDANVDLVNRNKYLEELILRVIDELGVDPNVDKRWLAIGKTNIEQGFMAINRSIFNPKRIERNEPSKWTFTV